MTAALPETTRPPGTRFPLAARALRGRPSASLPSGGSIAAAVSAAPLIKPQNNWALWGFLLLLPLQNIQVGYLPKLGEGFNFLNIMFALSLLMALAQGGKLAKGAAVNTWVLVFAANAVMSLFIGFRNVGDSSGHVAVLKDQMLGLFMVYLVQMSVRSWSDVRRLLLVMAIPLPYIAKVAWIQHLGVSSWHYSDDLRIPGTFTLLGANEFAAFCVTSAIVSFGLLVAARLDRKWVIGLIFCIACMVLCILYAYSRTAYVSLLLGVVTVVLAWRGRWKMMLPLLLAAAILPAVIPASVKERFDSTHVSEGSRDESTEMRLEFWKVAWDNFTRNPVVGTGYNTFHHTEINPFGKDTHNLYLRTLTEEGVLGFVALLGLLFSVLLAARREISAAPSHSLRYALALGIVGAWMALICANIFGDRFTYFPMISYFWSYVALMLKARHLPPEAVR